MDNLPNVSHLMTMNSETTYSWHSCISIWLFFLIFRDLLYMYIKHFFKCCSNIPFENQYLLSSLCLILVLQTQFDGILCDGLIVWSAHWRECIVFVAALRNVDCNSLLFFLSVKSSGDPLFMLLFWKSFDQICSLQWWIWLTMLSVKSS